MKRIVLYIICYILSINLYASQSSNDSLKIESIQKEMMECMNSLNNRTDYTSDAFLKKTIRTARRLDELANSYYSLTKDSTVYILSFMGEFFTAAIYKDRKMIDSAYIHSLKIYQLYEPYGRMICSSDTTGQWARYIFGNEGIYGIMREWNVNKGNLNEAIKYGTIIADSCKAMNADIEAVKSYLRLGEICEQMGDYKKSIEYQVQAIDDRLSYKKFGESPLASQIYTGILNTIEKLLEQDMLVNQESIEKIMSDSDFGSYFDKFVRSHPLDFCDEEEKLGKTFWIKQLFYTYIRLGERCKLYNGIFSFEEGLSDFIIRNDGKESIEFAEYLMRYSNLYNGYLKELNSDIEKEKYRLIAEEKQKQAFEIWKRYFEQNSIEDYASKYQKLKKIYASQYLKKEETAEELIRLHNILSSYSTYMFYVYSSYMKIYEYDKAYDALLKSIKIEEDLFKNSNPILYISLGETSFMMEDFVNAEKIFSKSYSLAYEKKDSLSMADANLWLSRLYANVFKEPSIARQKLSDAYKMVTEYSYHSFRKVEILEEMANYYKSMNNDVIAYSLLGLSQLEKEYCGVSLTDDDYIKKAQFLPEIVFIKDSVLLSHIQEIADKREVSKQVQKASERLGLFYAATLTDLEKGIFYYQKAANIAHELNDSISEASDVAEIGTILFVQKKYDNALTYMQKAERINPRLKYTQLLPLVTHIPNDSIVKLRLPFLYENNKKWLKKQLLSTNSEGREMLVRNMSYDVLKSMIYYYPNLPICADIAYNSTLLYKGLLQNTQKSVSEYIANSNDNDLKGKYNELQLIQNKEGQDEPTFEASLQSQIETSDLELSLLESLSRNKVLGDLEITWNDVRNKLGKNDVAIEFVEINRQECFDRSAFLYGALILRRDYKHPVFLELDSKDEIDKNINVLLHSANSSIRQTSSIWNTASEQLYKLIWGKLINHIHPGDNVFFSTDGLLHKTPIEFLSDGMGNYANEKYNMFRLSSTRELCKKRKEGISKVVLYGGLLFDATPKGQEVDSLDAFQNYEDSSERSGWNYLPASETEVDSISDLLASQGINVIKKKGLDGTEESFKDLSGLDLSIVHIATHGFYFPQKETQYLDYFQSQMDISPMKRSGLMMTGGQTAWMGKKKIEQEHDGILTSEEISKIDLNNVSMVVLSACQTGLGDIDTGAEGVIGIQRAFKLAGVQSLLMSLWKVDDAATSYMMQAFYSKMLSGDTKHNAFKAAQQEVRKKYPDPYYWAAFVMLD